MTRPQFTIADWLKICVVLGVCFAWWHDHDEQIEKIAQEQTKAVDFEHELWQLKKAHAMEVYHHSRADAKVSELTQQVASEQSYVRWWENRYWEMRVPEKSPPWYGGSENEGGCAPAPGGPDLMWEDKER